MPILMTDLSYSFTALLINYSLIEQSIQKLIAPIIRPVCVECAGSCCREEICRESIQSPFLKILVQTQGIAYDDRNGWLADTGCRLRYGRPQVCYTYFCNDMLQKQPEQLQKVNAVISAFSASGDRALGGNHLISIEKLDELSCHNISNIMNKMANVFGLISQFQSNLSLANPITK